MSTDEPTTIDEKKAEDSGSTTDKADWKGFSKTFSNSLITGIFLGVIVLGSVGLFLAKVANANILPTDCNIDIEPYPAIESTKDMVPPRVVPMEIIYMNPVKILKNYGLNFWSEPEQYYVQEANFINDNAKLNFMEDFKNSWLCSLKKKAYPSTGKDKANDILAVTSNIESSVPSGSEPEPGHMLDIEPGMIGRRSIDSAGATITPDINSLPQNSPFWAYEFETMRKTTCTSFSIINSVFFYMNYLPEWATMIMFALFFSVILTFIFLINWGYGLWVHLSNFGKMLDNLYNPEKFNENSLTNVIKPKGEWNSWSNIWFQIKNIFYVFVYFIGALYSAIIISPVIVTFYALFKALGANYVVRDKTTKEVPDDAPKQNVFSFIKSTLYYKKTFLIILVMINLMGITNEYLGPSYLPGVIIAILILIFGLKILETVEPVDLCLVKNPKFPSLNQPKVNLDKTALAALTPVDMCSDKPTDYIDRSANVTTVTGYLGSNVLENKTADNTTVPSKALIGGAPGLQKTKPKRKIYNLKLV